MPELGEIPMTEPTIVCPNCKTEIKLTESLAAPLIKSIRREYEQRLSRKDTDIAKRETSLREQEDVLSKARETIDDQIAERLRREHTKIVAEEAEKAKLALRTDLDQKTREITDLQEVLKQWRKQLRPQFLLPRVTPILLSADTSSDSQP